MNGPPPRPLRSGAAASSSSILPAGAPGVATEAKPSKRLPSCRERGAGRGAAGTLVLVDTSRAARAVQATGHDDPRSPAGDPRALRIQGLQRAGGEHELADPDGQNARPGVPQRRKPDRHDVPGQRTTFRDCRRALDDRSDGYADLIDLSTPHDPRENSLTSFASSVRPAHVSRTLRDPPDRHALRVPGGPSRRPLGRAYGSRSACPNGRACRRFLALASSGRASGIADSWDGSLQAAGFEVALAHSNSNVDSHGGDEADGASPRSRVSCRDEPLSHRFPDALRRLPFTMHSLEPRLARPGAIRPRGGCELHVRPGNPLLSGPRMTPSTSAVGCPYRESFKGTILLPVAHGLGSCGWFCSCAHPRTEARCPIASPSPDRGETA